MIIYAVCKYPTGDRCRSNGHVIAEKKTGHTNAYRHLKFCLSHCDESRLMKHYEHSLAETRKRNKEGLGKFSILGSPSAREREKVLNGYINLVLELSLPISIIDSNTQPKFSKQNSVFGMK